MTARTRRPGAGRCAPGLFALVVLFQSLVTTPGEAQDELRVAWEFGSLMDEQTALGGVSSIAEMADGRVAVLDARSPAIWILNTDGVLYKKFGRSGRGPGEFLAPTELYVAADTLVVSDYREQRQTLLSADGRVIGTRPLPRPIGRPSRSAWPTRGNGWYVEVPAMVTSAMGGDIGKHLLLWFQGETLDTIAEVASGHVVWYGPEKQFGVLPTHTGAGGAAAVVGDSAIVSVDGYQGTVTWWVIGAHGLQAGPSLTVPVAARPLEDAERQEMFEAFRTEAAAYSGYRTPRSVDFRGADRWSGIPEVLVSSVGAVWIAGPRGIQPGRQVWRQVAVDGVVDAVEFPKGFELLHVGRQYFYGKSTEPDGSVRVTALSARPPA